MPTNPPLEPPAKAKRAGVWLMVGTAVVALHAAVLLAVWQGWGSRPDPLTLAEGQSATDALVTIPVTPVAPPPRQRMARPRPALPRPPAAPSPGESTKAPEPATAGNPVESAPAGSEHPQETDAGTAPTSAPEPIAPRPTEPTPAAAMVVAPASARLRYEVLGNARGLGFHANGSLDWRQDGQRYEGRLEIGALFFGSRVQTSAGRLTPEGLRPERFSDAVRRERRLSFDHEAQQLRVDDGAPVPLPPGTQDRLSVFLQLAGLLAAAPVPEPGQRWNIPVAGLPTVEGMAFVFDGTETLNLPAGELQTLKLRREARREGDQQLEVWFAPELHYLPVRILLREANGDSADQRLRSR